MSTCIHRYVHSLHPSMLSALHVLWNFLMMEDDWKAVGVWRDASKWTCPKHMHRVKTMIPISTILLYIHDKLMRKVWQYGRLVWIILFMIWRWFLSHVTNCTHYRLFNSGNFFSPDDLSHQGRVVKTGSNYRLTFVLTDDMLWNPCLNIRFLTNDEVWKPFLTTDWPFLTSRNDEYHFLTRQPLSY